MTGLSNTVTLKSAKHKVTEFRQGNGPSWLLVKSQDLQLDLRELMSYRLTPVHYSLGTANSFNSR